MCDVTPKGMPTFLLTETKKGNAHISQQSSHMFLSFVCEKYRNVPEDEKAMTADGLLAKLQKQQGFFFFLQNFIQQRKKM